jgi:hypothetical protein
MGAAAAAFAAMIAGAARPEGRASVVLAAVVGVAGWWSGPSAAMGIGALALCHAAWAAWRGRPPVGLVTALVCGLAPGPAVLAAAVGAAAGAAALRPVDVRLLAPIAVVAAARLAVGWAS